MQIYKWILDCKTLIVCDFIESEHGQDHEVHGEQPHVLHQVHEELQGCWGVVGHFQCLLRYYCDGGLHTGER